MNDCVKYAVPTLQAKHVEHELHTPKKLILVADRSALKTLVFTLVSNAVNPAKSSCDEGTIMRFTVPVKAGLSPRKKD